LPNCKFTKKSAKTNTFAANISMLLPYITDYISTLDNPSGVFRTLENIAVERDIYGEPDFRAGNSAAIFTYPDHCGKRRSLKCYIRPNPYLHTIYSYVEQLRSPLLPSVRLLREELYVHSLSGDAGWVDLVEGEWTDGQTLDAIVRKAIHTGNKTLLRELADAFDILCRRLSAEEWAHGDLKPENIIVRSETSDGCTGTVCVPPNVSLTLIDCDAMWIPALAGQKAVELGTPPWRDPERTAAHFDKHIDDYPMMTISSSLHAIAVAPDGPEARFFL
jgi:hypothetical protein